MSKQAGRFQPIKRQAIRNRINAQEFARETVRYVKVAS